VDNWAAIVLITAAQYCTPCEVKVPEPVVRLSTRDKNLKKQFQLSPAELLADELDSQSDASLAELVNEIMSVKPGISKKGINRKAILESELSRIKDSIAPVGLGINAMNLNTGVTQSVSSTPLNQVMDFLSNMWSTK